MRALSGVATQPLGERDRQPLPARRIVDLNLPDEGELNRQRGHQRERGEVVKEGEEGGHVASKIEQQSKIRKRIQQTTKDCQIIRQTSHIGS